MTAALAISSMRQIAGAASTRSFRTISLATNLHDLTRERNRSLRFHESQGYSNEFLKAPGAPQVGQFDLSLLTDVPESMLFLTLGSIAKRTDF